MSDVGMRQGSELAGKVALVTGAARNIGRAIARSLAAGGAAVMVKARISRAEAEKTVAMIESAGGQAAWHLADVTNAKEVSSLVEAAVSRFGRLDFLVNNAAVRYETAFASISHDEWRSVLSVGLDGAFFCVQAALPHLIRAGGGAIVNIGGQRNGRRDDPRRQRSHLPSGARHRLIGPLIRRWIERRGGAVAIVAPSA